MSLSISNDKQISKLNYPSDYTQAYIHTECQLVWHILSWWCNNYFYMVIIWASIMSELPAYSRSNRPFPSQSSTEEFILCIEQIMHATVLKWAPFSCSANIVTSFVWLNLWLKSQLPNFQHFQITGFQHKCSVWGLSILPSVFIPSHPILSSLMYQIIRLASVLGLIK